MNLLHQQETKEGIKTLYCVSYENWRTRVAGHIYLLAKNRDDAVNQVLTNKIWGAMTRVIGIAPAVGVHYMLSESGEVQEVVYQ